MEYAKVLDPCYCANVCFGFFVGFFSPCIIFPASTAHRFDNTCVLIEL